MSIEEKSHFFECGSKNFRDIDCCRNSFYGREVLDFGLDRFKYPCKKLYMSFWNKRAECRK